MVQKNVAKEGADEKKWCLLFHETDKPLVLNSTNICRRSSKSDDTDHWLRKACGALRRSERVLRREAHRRNSPCGSRSLGWPRWLPRLNPVRTSPLFNGVRPHLGMTMRSIYIRDVEPMKPFLVVSPAEYVGIDPVVDGQGPMGYACDVVHVEASTRRDAKALGVALFRQKHARYLRHVENPPLIPESWSTRSVVQCMASRSG